MDDVTIRLKDLIDFQTPINYPDQTVTIFFDSLGNSAHFNDKNFTCKKLIFEHINNPEFNFRFKNCFFDCDVEFTNINLNEIYFKNTNSIKSLSISKGPSEHGHSEINYFTFSNDHNIAAPELNTSFSIRATNIGSFTFQYVKHVKGKFQLFGNVLGNKNNFISFQNSTITNPLFGDNTFKTFTTFKRVNFNFTEENLRPPGSAFEFPGFYKNSFFKVSFSYSEFIDRFQFENCDFDGTTLFDEIKNIENSNLHFNSCKFSGFTHFGLSEINRITFEYVLFERSVSFKNSNFNYIKFEETKFEKGAFFDDLNKTNSKVITKWNRTTIREIKRELANTHNQIDYLKFKAYELKAYKNEVDKSKLNWRDTLILYFNEESNNFGLDWTKGIRFIFQWSFIFYIFYIISYSCSVNDLNCIPKIDNLLINYLKFLNPFSFLKSPIDDAENYFLPFFFFLFGKIFVSYGIYQTAQAFRKFGVNGG